MNVRLTTWRNADETETESRNSALPFPPVDTDGQTMVPLFSVQAPTVEEAFKVIDELLWGPPADISRDRHTPCKECGYPRKPCWCD